MSGSGPEAAACVTTQAPAHGIEGHGMSGVTEQSVKAEILVNEVSA
ncbi:hypothetical protein [Nocardia vermiculata]|uniref:Uncharacterized protein n=1 Tax=Nocardia vermiculata TaxID=257274 RepID=A0A846XZA5_9NOCA|nr:hypothetical protein [Nocardia vermiculata]NKY51202.1 hypothetical protein [Nocardia vermiculata]